jgi:hypothetical protein
MRAPELAESALGAGGPGFKSRHPDQNPFSAARAKADVPTETADAVVADNMSTRVTGLCASLALLILIALLGRPSPGAARRCRPSRPQPRRRAVNAVGSAAAECHAAPSALAAGGAGHATVEAATRKPDPERELEAQQVEDSDRRNPTAPLALDYEGALSSLRIVRYGTKFTLFGMGSRVERVSSHRQRHGGRAVAS